jgi:hypothetical protein
MVLPPGSEKASSLKCKNCNAVFSRYPEVGSLEKLKGFLKSVLVAARDSYCLSRCQNCPGGKSERKC